MKISLTSGCEEIRQLLEKYSMLQEKVKEHVVKISECINCKENGKIILNSEKSAYGHINEIDEADIK